MANRSRCPGKTLARAGVSPRALSRPPEPGARAPAAPVPPPGRQFPPCPGPVPSSSSSIPQPGSPNSSCLSKPNAVPQHRASLSLLGTVWGPSHGLLLAPGSHDPTTGLVEPQAPRETFPHSC